MISLGIVNWGGDLSTTCITCDAVAVFPASSFAVQVTVVFPNWNDAGALFVTDTSCTLSLDVAFPMLTRVPVELVALTITSCGAVIFGAVVSTTFTV